MVAIFVRWSATENIEYFIEDQAFLGSMIRLPSPRPSPSPASKLSLFLSLPVCRAYSVIDGRGWELVGEEPNCTTARKPGPL